MKKLLFFDYRELEHLEGFSRAVESPIKHPDAPLLRPDEPWEHGNMQLFGSVLQAADGRFRAWYEVVEAPWTVRLAYAESDDGLRWHKPQLDVFRDGERLTNVVFNAQPLGTAVIEDRQDPRPTHRYKLLTGAEPSGCVSAFHSADGLHWESARMFGGRVQPVIATAPDCPIGFLRAPDGRFVAYHRMAGYGRRVFRSESWDFAHWSVSRAWCWSRTPAIRHRRSSTDWAPAPTGRTSSARSGSTPPIPVIGDRARCGGCRRLSWPMRGLARPGHRAQPGTAFIANGAAGEWDCGNLQPASQPVFLDDEIRYYYAGTNARHAVHWELAPQEAGLGMARLKPDRFVARRRRGASRTGGR